MRDLVQLLLLMVTNPPNLLHLRQLLHRLLCCNSLPKPRLCKVAAISLYNTILGLLVEVILTNQSRHRALRIVHMANPTARARQRITLAAGTMRLCEGAFEVVGGEGTMIVTRKIPEVEMVLAVLQITIGTDLEALCVEAQGDRISSGLIARHEDQY